MNNTPNNISDELLVSKYQNGDMEALKVLIKRYQPKLVNAINSQTRDHTVVDDLVQECWYAIINKLAGLELKICFEAWAVTIARRKAIDWVRQQQSLRTKAKEIQLEAAADQRQQQMEPVEDRAELVQQGLQLLPRSHQIILTMFYMEKMKLHDISRVLGITEGTVKSRLYYAREKLKTLMEQLNKG